MIPYLIKSTICIAVFLGFYKLFLEKENMHKIKRFYLLGSLIFAGIIPLITLTYTKIVEIPVTAQEISQQITQDIPLITQTAINETPYWHYTLWSIYGIGVVVFLFRFMLNLRRIKNEVDANEKEIKPSHTRVLLSKPIVPHSFWNYIFIPKKAYKTQQIPEEVLLHEQAHVKQKHTLDIVLLELLQIIFWFNPLWYLMKKAVKLNHEFLADQEVLAQKIEVKKYQKLLIEYPQDFNYTALSSAVNYSLTKKRLYMMTTHFSKKRTAIKLAMLIPVIGFSALAFNHGIEAKEEFVFLKENIAIEELDQEKRAHQIMIYVKGEKEIFINGKLAKGNITKLLKKEAEVYRKKGIKNVKAIVYGENGIDHKKAEKTVATYLKKANVELLQYNDLSTAQVASLPDTPPPPPPVPAQDIKGDLAPPPPPAPTLRDVLTGKVRVVRDGEEIHVKETRLHKEHRHEAPEEAAIETVEEVEIVEDIAPIEEHYEIVEIEEELIEEAIADAESAAHRAVEEAMLVKERLHITEEQARIIAERAQVKAEESARRALERAEVARVRAEERREIAVERAREHQIRAHEQAERTRAHRVKAHEQAERARMIAREEMEKQREVMRKVREEMREDRERIHRKYEKEREALQKERMKEMKRTMKKMEKKARRVERKAEKEAEKMMKEIEEQMKNKH